jgi:hypothetical protein
MSITAKLASLTHPNKITIDEDVYDILHPEIKSKFTEIKYDIEKWKYIDKHTEILQSLMEIPNTMSPPTDAQILLLLVK